MATFEETATGTKGEDDMEYSKFSLRRMEPAIQKFLKVVQIDLGRLHSHKLNMERYNRLHDWSSLNVEQINATRTLQQLQSNLREIEKCRNQVEDGDLDSFDRKIEPVKNTALRSLAEFLPLCQKSEKQDQSSSDSSPEGEVHILGQGQGQTSTPEGEGEIKEPLLQTQLNERPENTEVAQSWEALQENLEDLNTMIHQFAHMVDDQQENLDKVENNIESAQSDVQEGVKHLGKTTGYKAALFPLIGAAVGTVIGGPIGFAAGLKLGGLVGIVGGTATGYLSGSMLKKRQQETVDIELSGLSRSTSEPAALNESEESGWFSWGRKRNQSASEKGADEGIK
ncbi:syntaxin-17-like [Mya arenaria]|uniref:syntaxin-17-like n=1 Tax=Mya arenaria TaxID=6604 RepID=UPI0022E1D943|nr:syntaxin-17-like [Mya arenaria]XP_052813241.1 syntaxin-17-like [Mya arenaria]XP_052813242.1 syntaxin-17-like [Mya arenaria]